MATIIETLEACKVIVDALAVGASQGLSYHPANMVELSNHIAVAIEESRLTKRALDGLTPAQKEEVRQMIQSALDTGSA